MEIAFHPAAVAEFRAAVAYHEGLEPGLGAALADEVLRKIELARLFPALGASEQGAVRSLVTKRFPFLIYYEVVAGRLWIWAVMHAAREPGYWKARQKR